MGSIYKGYGGHKSYVGYCEGGIIYSGKTPIGRYENGSIYNRFKEHVGSYSGGSIYNQFGDHIGSYESGIVYNKYQNFVVGKEQVGSYEDDPAEAAALILLFLGESDVNGEETKEVINNTPDMMHSSNSTGGCLSVLFGLAVVIIGVVIRLLLPVLKIFFLGFWLAALFSLSWAGLLSGFLMVGSASIGLIPLAVLFGVFAGLIAFSFYPYWAVLMWKKIKKLLTWKEIVRYYGIWFLKGPFAYHILKAEVLTKKECVNET